MGFRTVMDVIPLQAELVKGSHGRVPENKEDYPVLITNKNDLLPKETIKATEVFTILEAHINK